MECAVCRQENDNDAAFCAGCGQPLAESRKEPPYGRRKAYWLALAPVLAIAIAAGVGYYKFVLPDGVAAVVNGEEIRLSEVDAAVHGIRQSRESVTGVKVPESEVGRIRHAVLSEMITERIALQEARKAGVSVARDDVDAAIGQLRVSTGMDERAFAAYVEGRFGNRRAFEAAVERGLCINRYVTGVVTAGITDPAQADRAASQWLASVAGRAAVRISMTEQYPASGCGCCNKGPGAKQPGSPPAGGAAIDARNAKAAQEAALKYMKEKYGAGPVKTKLTDFGCHIQVDVVQGDKIARSLRYQNGIITEM
jgi:hypothetical protein